LKKRPESLVVGILGAGHVRHGHGVAHQLKNLGVERTGTLLTWDHGDACAEIAQGMADAVYVVRPPAGAPPRLGVTMEADAAGVRITHVVPGSVAEKADLKAGDVVLEVAGQPARSGHTLRGAVQRQAPGTWLPMKIRREGKELELVARFPAGA
jgi:predicted metalloprotease with PDZ domain